MQLVSCVCFPCVLQWCLKFWVSWGVSFSPAQRLFVHAEKVNQWELRPPHSSILLQSYSPSVVFSEDLNWLEYMGMLTSSSFKPSSAGFPILSCGQELIDDARVPILRAETEDCWGGVHSDLRLGQTEKPGGHRWMGLFFLLPIVFLGYPVFLTQSHFSLGPWRFVWC